MRVQVTDLSFHEEEVHIYSNDGMDVVLPPKPAETKESRRKRHSNPEGGPHPSTDHVHGDNGKS